MSAAWRAVIGVGIRVAVVSAVLAPFGVFWWPWLVVCAAGALGGSWWAAAAFFLWLVT